MRDWIMKLLPWYDERAVKERSEKAATLQDDAEYAVNRADQVYYAYMQATLRLARNRGRTRIDGTT
jgi:hypothetical protein